MRTPSTRPPASAPPAPTSCGSRPTTVRCKASDTVTIVVQAPAKSSPPTNTPPTVNAGPDRTIGLRLFRILDVTVSDVAAVVARVGHTLDQVSGPGTVSFGNASAVDTTATFSQAGTYVLRLTASDGLYRLRGNNNHVQAARRHEPPTTDPPKTRLKGKGRIIGLCRESGPRPRALRVFTPPFVPWWHETGLSCD